MAVRSDTFRVVFDVVSDGTVKAAFSGVGKAAEDAAKQIDATGDRWERLGMTIGSAIKIGGVAVAGALALIVRNTMQAEQELAQLDAVLKSTGNAAGFSRDQLVSMANELSKNSIFSGGEIAAAQTRLLSYSNIVGETFPRAMQAVIDMSARYGMSVEQAAETVGKALQTPSKATQALARQGYEFSEAQIKVMKALEDTGREAEAQAMILEAMEESQEGAARAARETLGGALIALKNTLADLMTGGDGSLDSTTRAVNDLIDTLNDPAVRQGFADIVDGILSVTGQAAAAIPMLVEFNAQLSKAYGIGTQQGQTRAGNIGDFLAGNRDFWESALRGEFNAGANARIRAGFAGGSIANFSNVSTADPRNALADFSNVSTADPRAASRTTGGGGGGNRKKQLSDEERAAQALARAYENYNAQLHRSNELFGEQKELAKVNYEIQFGALKGLDPVMADHLRAQAEWLDMQEEIAIHDRIATEAREEYTEALKRQEEAYEDLVGSLRTELELMDMSRASARALLDIRRLGISETSAEADEIRALHAAIEDNERAIAAMDELRAAGSDLLVDLASGESPLKALEDSLDRLNSRLLQMVADNLMEQIFGSFGSTGQGTGGGDWLSRIFGGLFGSSGGSAGGAWADANGIGAPIQVGTGAAGGGFWSSIFGALFGGGRAYGGPTRPNMLYEINELGAPEVYRGANGKTWMLTGNQHGDVVPMDAYAPGSRGGDNYYITVPADGLVNHRTRLQYADDLQTEIFMSRRNR